MRLSNIKKTVLSAGLTLSMLAAMTPAVLAAEPVQDGYARYEAEDAFIYGAGEGKEIETNDDYSGGKAAANLDKYRSGFDALDFEFKNTSHVEFTVSREESGIVEVIVGCKNSGGPGSDRPANDIAVKSNDGTPKRVVIGGKTTASVKVDLQKGENTIYVSTTLGDKPDNGWVNIDYIDVSNVTEEGSVEPPEKEIVQPKNPIITSIYTADPSAHVWEDGRIYIYASHDTDPPQGCDLMDRYHVFSSDNMVDWIDEGEILNCKDVEWDVPGSEAERGFMWAPDAAYRNGTYYFYYPHPTGPKWNDSWAVGVATSRFPDKDFTDQGPIKGWEGSQYNNAMGYFGGDSMIDPCIFVDDDGTPYMYLGGGGKCVVAELNDDMMSLKTEPVFIADQLEDYHEGSWVFKRNNTYYLMYPDNAHGGNNMRYATAESPLGPWTSQGIILDSTGSDTSHGSIAEYKGEWYIFYHNQAISGRGSIRSVCVDKVNFNEDGTIQKVVQTDTSVDPVGPLLTPSEDMITYPVSAENVSLEGDAKLMENEKAPNGQVVTNLHKEGSAVVLTNVDGGTVGGRATIGLNFSTPDKGKLKLIVNGVDYSFVNTLPTGGKSFFTGHSEFTVNNMLPGTQNTIRLEGGNSRVFLDNVTVTPFNDANEEPPVVTEPDTAAPVISAESPQAEVYEGETKSVEEILGLSVQDDVDGDITSDSSKVQIATDYDAEKTGTYTVTVTAADAASNTAVSEFTITVIGKPYLNYEDTPVVQGSAFDPLAGVKAFDNDGKTEITDRLVVVSNSVDVKRPGTYTVVYSLKDSRGTEFTFERTVEVVKKDGSGTKPNTQKPTPNTNGTGTVKTGDTANIAVFWGLSAAALILALMSLVLKRRKFTE